MPRKEKKFHIIYKTTNKITGKFYIGMHSTDDLNDGYFGSGIRLKYSLSKYGKENHITEILELCETREILKLRERDFVNEKLLDNSLCMNLTIGGIGGYIENLEGECYTTIWWDKLKQDNPEEYKRRCNSLKKNGSMRRGKKHSEETIKKLSEIASKKVKEKNPFYKKTHSDETKRLMREYRLNTCWVINPYTEECKIVKLDILDNLLEEGWIRGRKIKNSH